MPRKGKRRPEVGSIVHMRTNKYARHGLQRGVDYRVVDIEGAIVAIRGVSSLLKPHQVWVGHVKPKPRCMFD